MKIAAGHAGPREKIQLLFQGRLGPAVPHSNSRHPSQISMTVSRDTSIPSNRDNRIMAQVIPFDPQRFRSAADHYLSGRPPYPDRLIELAARLCGLTAEDRVLDLGCGPAQLARAFATRAKEVVAIDPEPEMLAVGRQLAGDAGLSNVSFRQGSSYDIGPGLGTFRLTVIGRAFHWMDREDTLRRLDRMIQADGAIALFNDDHPKLPENAWVADFEQLIDRFSPPDEHRQYRKSPIWQRHESILLASPFSQLESVSVIEKRRLSIDTLIDRAFSRSTSTRQRLGEQADQLAAEIRTEIGGRASDGMIEEVVETSALIARRPG